MIRRNFLSNLFKLFSILLIVPKKSFALIQQNYLGKTKKVELFSKSTNISKSIPLYIRQKIEYISLTDFAQTLHYSIYTNNAKRKSVLYLGSNKFRFTADNSFVVLNEDVLQMPVECKWQEGEIHVPVIYLAKFLSRYTSLFVSYNQQANRITIESADTNITGVEIKAKENGTLIYVRSLKKFGEKEILMDIRNGWFHIDIYGAKIDTASISSVPGKGIISKVEGIQLGETASIAFKLKGKIESRDLVFQENEKDFIVNLRTPIKLDNNNHEKMNRDLEAQRKKWFIDTIVLDAGHGGKDPGAVGYNKVKEKDIVLPIVLKLGKLIKQKLPNVKIVYTRKTDVFIPLWKRTEIANKANGKLFISVHANGSTSSKLNGFETYFLSADKDEKAKGVVLKENSVIEFEESVDRQRYQGVNFILATMAQSAFIKQSQYLASVIQSALKGKLEKIGMSDRGVKQGPFWVMVGATMPNVLVEAGFLSNKYESKKLIKTSTQNKVAEAIYQGIVKYKTDTENAI